ncbi:MAG: glycosyltransferase family 39 protein, partial [Planctomycetales bacterium]|nr:glycosyltransferase family 39 protein [Planctomycetales bacterium]
RLNYHKHLVIDGHFASRYFPGTGLWLAPFVAWGHPHWGQWLAGAITSVLIFWIGRELHSNRLGFIAGSLTALAPGMGMFSNLLLAHHPTLVGLSVFLLAFLRLVRTGSGIAATVAGVGLTYAMLCRPMTAAGVALPCGVYFAWWVLAKPPHDEAFGNRIRVRAVAGLGIPLLLGFVGLFCFNRAITGDGFYSPYQQFTDVYTPRHGYGFNNVIRGEQKLTPRVIDNYDRWAENLTPSVAAMNVWKRHVASWQWTLGIIPLLLATVVVLICPPRCRGPWWLIPAGIVSLQAVHIPYWFVGMLDYHYVFESGPLWTLVFGLATCQLVDAWHAAQRRMMTLWWGAVVATSFAMSFLSFEPFWAGWLYRGVVQMVFARGQHAGFQQLMKQAVVSRPAIVLIDPDPADRHIDYVTNRPDLQNDLLLGRYIPDIVSIPRVQELFPDRTVYVFRYRNRGYERTIDLNIVSQPSPTRRTD